jgi:hypothetical protein
MVEKMRRRGDKEGVEVWRAHHHCDSHHAGEAADEGAALTSLEKRKSTKTLDGIRSENAPRFTSIKLFLVTVLPLSRGGGHVALFRHRRQPQ